jgi:hypothetical protein
MPHPYPVSDIERMSHCHGVVAQREGIGGVVPFPVNNPANPSGDSICINNEFLLYIGIVNAAGHICQISMRLLNEMA